MSRTDKTKPLIVKIWHGDIAGQEVHRHEGGGPCDLPRTLAEARGATACRLDYVWTGIGLCCCPLCRLTPGHRQAISSTRARDKARLKRRAMAWNAGDTAAFDDVESSLRYRS